MALLVVTVALAGSPGAGPQATASAVSPKKFKQLKKQVEELEAKVDELQKQPGPQGPQGIQGEQGLQGPAGTAPACQGNGSGDTMVSAGAAVCIDKYEVSVWSSPTGGTQYGTSSDNYPCNDNGQDCDNIYARSVPGVTPSSRITYFQAQQALANVGKRLPTNAEWQQAVAGTPDPGASPGAEDCNTNSSGSVATGSLDNCVSTWGANDMVGNLHEWVGDWDEEAGGCANWPAGYGSDFTCIGRADTQASTRFPGALIRGGGFGNSANAGPFYVDGAIRPSASPVDIGFRGAR